MSHLTEPELKALDIKLLNYSIIDKLIRDRKLELETNHGADYLGISRKYHVSKPVETIAIRWDNDIKLKNLELFKETVQGFIGLLDEEQAKIFKYRWLSSKGSYRYSWEEIAELIGKTDKDIYRKRKALLAMFNYLLR